MYDFIYSDIAARPFFGGPVLYLAGYQAGVASVALTGVEASSPLFPKSLSAVN
ncbi:hypothetical protein NT01EI_2345 [Edwardsiella ictaluri 93-146]|uniref:Uncharacterized protein n=1 Tax=Edwardsiella ictaluri (strain 93-146) TaxID=634503 RepID=C5B8E6_EDWI9|nr:hypothetical protein NT01EI_2345 [Edwardsiella ictaluri 93-146]